MYLLKHTKSGEFFPLFFIFMELQFEFPALFDKKEQMEKSAVNSNFPK